jgi:hypothetical protein
VVRLLPEKLPPTHSSRKTKVNVGFDEAEIRDFRLPLLRIPREVTLRQIVVGESLRIKELWWALYDGGRRSDVWYFTAGPDPMTDNKILSNYEIKAASVSAGSDLELRVLGTMFRPGGAWWVTGKVFSFSMRDEKLMLVRVRNAFGFFQDYDRGDSPPAIDVSTEHEVSGRFEALEYDSVPDGTLRACRFRDPLLAESLEFSWAEMEKVALCVTEKPKARSSYRGFDEPSFVERGGEVRK